MAPSLHFLHFMEQEKPMKFILIALLIAGVAYYFYSSSNN